MTVEIVVAKGTLARLYFASVRQLDILKIFNTLVYNAVYSIKRTRSIQFSNALKFASFIIRFELSPVSSRVKLRIGETHRNFPI